MSLALTPAAIRYLGGLYESAVDLGLDLEAVRLFLASKGIARTPGQERYDLNEEFEFVGYADSRPDLSPDRSSVREVTYSLRQASLSRPA